MKAIFTTKVSPAYDDLPEVRYQFPRAYIRQVEAAVGDWIIYYEPRRSTVALSSRGGRQAYFATARLDRIVPDPVQSNLFLAEVSNFLPFVRAVPFKEGSRYFELGLEKHNGSTNKGAFGRAVRNISDSEYHSIWQSGFAHVLGNEYRIRPTPDVPESPMEPYPGLHEPEVELLYDIPMMEDRRIVQQLISRPFRDRAFSAAVKTAYQDSCAMTGLKFINGGGRSEVQAAHIRPVEKFGPDSVRNGIALSATVHWMFDRGLISVDGNFEILIAKDQVPSTIDRLFAGNRKLILPNRKDLYPHQKFLDYHRSNIFKG